ncbi:MAG: FAD-dependent oxidoreductase [Deltaproteobacteria bacterium]|nr:FAD-dependent oxidoreductase [Deltaproteobacteria bacterium]
MEKKVGVYLCTGCSIGESLDIEKLRSLATSEYHVEVCRVHPFLCEEEGTRVIIEDAENEGISAVVVAACSQRVNTDIFNFPSMVVERVNLREQVAWCHRAGEEETSSLAGDCLRMGIVKARKIQLPEPYLEAGEKSILVIGGGITGMTCAVEAADAGYDVALVEKSPRLGGWVSGLNKQFPKQPPYHDLQDTGIDLLIRKVEENPRIRTLVSSEIAKISGGPGAFDVTTAGPDGEISFRTGSIVLSTGFRPYDATKLGHLGYGRSADVITSVEMETMASTGSIVRPSDGRIPERVAFIQCAGSRDDNHLPYCSSFCCMTSLKQAAYLRETAREIGIFIFYKDMRVPGVYERFYARMQEDEGIFLTKGDVSGVSETDDGRLLVTMDNALLGEHIGVKVDMVVLATGMVPSTLGEEILKLEYRQGGELPTLKYGFPDSHFLCFPFETQRTGIYAAGCVRQPMDGEACQLDARGAALKAIQCVEMTAEGTAVHPRSGDTSFPDLFLQRCTDCKRCTEECPFGMYNENEKGTPLPNPSRCRRCGICLGCCPERIISFADYSIDIVASMIKSIDVPDEDEEKIRVLAFVCENDVYPALDLVGLARMSIDPSVRVVPLRCIGSVHLVWIADALSKGIDGILLIGCKHGEDYQCHFIKGSELAEYRIGKIQETLDRLALESERVRFLQLAMDEYRTIPGIIAEFMETLKAVGPNPFKGFS